MPARSCCRTLRRLAALLAGLALASPAPAQSPPTTPAGGGPPRLEGLVAPNRILADQGVLDGFGHVSVRHPERAGRLLLSRSLAPALTKTDDIMEYDLDC